MNQRATTSNYPQLVEEMRSTSEHIHADLARKRAQRNVRDALESIPKQELDFPIHETVNPNDNGLDLEVSFDKIHQDTASDFDVFDPSDIIPEITEAAEMVKNQEIPVPEKTGDVDLMEIDLDFTKGMPVDVAELTPPTRIVDEKPIAVIPPVPPILPKRIPRVRKPDEVSYEISISDTAKAHAESRRSIVDEMLQEQSLTQNWTADEIVESIAIKKSHEEQWDSLKINEICIPDAEVSLWSGFFKIFNPTNSANDRDKKYEEGDIYDIKLDGFDRFYLSVIRKAAKKSLMFCVVNSKRSDQDKAFVFEILVKLPIREWEIMSVYRNRNVGPKLINSWTVKQVFLRKHRETNPKRKGILKLLGF